MTVIFSLLSACATVTPPPADKKLIHAPASKKLEYEAMLSDPQIKKDFRAMKKVAMDATINKNDGKPTFSQTDLKKLNALSDALVSRLQEHYHVDASKQKTHTYIGKNQYDSCYQYYNSYSSYMGKACSEFSSDFSSCDQCDDYIKTLRTRSKRVILSKWFKEQNTAALVDTFKLRNGDSVYLGLEFTEK